MTLSDRVGTLRFYQQQGQAYADMCRGSFTASTFVTAAAVYLGMGKVGALILGAVSMVFWQVLAIGFGWGVVRWHVYRAQQTRLLEVDPVTNQTLGLLREIAQNTAR